MPHRLRFRNLQFLRWLALTIRTGLNGWKIPYRKLLVALIAIAAVLLLGVTLPRRSALPAQANCEARIYIASDNFHTTLIVPIATPEMDWRGMLPTAPTLTGESSYPYLGFGWGEQLYYTRAPENPILKLLAGLKAIFWLNDSVMSVTEYVQLPVSNAAIEVKAISISRENYGRLVEFIHTSFQGDRTGQAIPIPEAANYYRATGKYSLLRTCNTWTAEGLDRAGVETPLWSALALSVMRHLRSSCGG